MFCQTPVILVIFSENFGYVPVPKQYNIALEAFCLSVRQIWVTNLNLMWNFHPHPKVQIVQICSDFISTMKISSNNSKRGCTLSVIWVKLDM